MADSGDGRHDKQGAKQAAKCGKSDQQAEPVENRGATESEYCEAQTEADRADEAGPRDADLVARQGIMHVLAAIKLGPKFLY